MSSRFCWLNSGTTAPSLSSWRSQSASREHRALPEAVLLAGSSVDAKGELNILANSKEFITADGAGVSGGGTAGVSGTVDVILNENTVLAIVQDNANGTKPLIRAGAITLDALDDYQLIGVAASASAGATAGAGVTVQDVNQLIRQFEEMKKQMKIWLKQKKQLLKLHLKKQKMMHSTVNLKTIQQMKTNRYEGLKLSLT